MPDLYRLGVRNASYNSYHTKTMKLHCEAGILTINETTLLACDTLALANMLIGHYKEMVEAAKREQRKIEYIHDHRHRKDQDILDKPMV